MKTGNRTAGVWSLVLVLAASTGALLWLERPAHAGCDAAGYVTCGQGCSVGGSCTNGFLTCNGNTWIFCNTQFDSCSGDGSTCGGPFNPAFIQTCNQTQYQCNGLQPQSQTQSCVDCGAGCQWGAWTNLGAACSGSQCCGNNICSGSCVLVNPSTAPTCQSGGVTQTCTCSPTTRCSTDRTAVENGTPGCVAGTPPTCTCNYTPSTCTNGTCLDPGVCVVLAAVTSFSATSLGAGNTLRWTTGAEKGNLGFNVYRVDAGGKVLGKVNKALVTGPISSVVGSEYSLVDASGQVGDRYVLESIDARMITDRSTPVEATAGVPVPITAREMDLQLLRARSASIRAGLRAVRRAYDLRQVVRGLNPKGILYSTLPSEKLGLRIKVTRDALYRVAVKDLEQGGLKVTGLTQDKLSLSSNGQAVPFRVSASPLGAGDHIEFYGQENRSPQSATTVYFLGATTDASAKLTEKASAPVAGKTAAQYEALLSVEENKIYQWGKNLSDPFYWAWLLPSTPLFETTFTADSLAPGATTFHFSGRIDGITDNPAVNPDHHVKVFLNGTLVKDATWDGRKLLSFDAELPISGLKEGTNTIRVEQVNDTGSPYDLSAVDGFTVRYSRKLVAQGNRLAFEVDGSEPNVSVAGFTSSGIEVYDVTVPERPTRLTGVDIKDAGGTTTASFARTDSGSGTYLVLTVDNMKEAAAIEQRFGSDLLAKTNEADLLIISYDAFAPALGPLVDLRRSQGLRVAVVTTSEIFDQFSHGNVSDKAIKDFIVYAAANWRAPTPRHVLLVGDTSNDPRDELKLGRLNYVPSHLVPSQSWGGVTSDTWYVDLKDQGNYQIGIGRLTVQTLGETTTAVAKAVAYDKAAASPLKGSNRVIVVADASKPNSAERFEATAQALLAEVPATYQKVGFYFKDYKTADEASAALVKELNQGSLLVVYIGHGSGLSWGSGGEFISKTIPTLAADVHAPLVVSLSCVTGYLGYAGLEIFSQAFVKPADRGAIAAWSTSDAGSPLIYETLGKAFVRNLFKNGVAPVGDAVRAALNETVASGKEPELRQTTDTFIYFGDPMQKLHVVADTIPTTEAGLPKTDGRVPGVDSGNGLNPGGTAGCGCQVSGIAGAGWMVVALLLLGAIVIRRRTRSR
jgi:MYXO-CTERM domain-containing protein